ncbi:MAG: hypothetical protein A3K18_12430 [Lentisphaerae bacterium RIFOXYA12_64_32]|nr:MAG: hypothetical protein A3K18_12430 [Lentisphaerae bacterium RIFOXYA12_64_32]
MVIAIIAILASMLLPALQQAKDKANCSTCQSNVKQLLVGTSMYVQDNDQHLPMATDTWGGNQVSTIACCGGGLGKGWSYNRNPNPYTKPVRVGTGYVHWRVNEVVGNWDVWKCPGMTTAVDAQNSDQASYLSSLVITNRPNDPRYLPLEGVKETMLKVDPSVITVWQDAVTWYETTGAQNLFRSSGLTGNYLTSHGGGPGYSARTQVGFFDGHASSMSVPEWWKVIHSNTPWRKP